MEEGRNMTLEILNEQFSPYGIRLLQEIGNHVYLIEHARSQGERQVLKVIDILKKAREEANETYSEETLKILFESIHGKELIWNKKITLTECEYLVRILEPYTIGSPDDDVFLYAIRMPYYDTLDSLCESSTLDENAIIQVGMDVCNALRTLHHDSQNEYIPNATVKLEAVLHLDIKPDNIFYEDIEGRKTFMLGDFGTLVAKGNGALPMRTDGYYAPELKDFHVIPTEVCDIFSLGMVLFRCLCKTEDELKTFWEMRLQNQEAVRPANCSPQLWSVIECATRTKAEERYQSAADMLSALSEIHSNKLIVVENKLNVAEEEKKNVERKAKQKAIINTVIHVAETAALVAIALAGKKKTPDKTECIKFDPFGFYEGGTRNGKPQGSGKFTYQYGSETKSILGFWEWVSEKKLTITDTEIVYTGMLCDGHPSGYGKIQFPRIGIFEGVTNAEQFQIGTLVLENGEQYSGMWEHKDGVEYQHGEGTYIYADGTEKSGRWEYGKLVEEIKEYTEEQSKKTE